MSSKSSKRSSFQLPVIPPLPSSKGFANKENASETPFRSSKAAKRTPRSSSSRRPFQENVFRTNSPSVATTRILRTAESMESLFCFTSRTTQEYRDLCRQICDGRLADDAAAWEQALRVARKEVIASSSSQSGSDKPIPASSLLRLHRRAKSRFSLLEKPGKNAAAVTKVHLSYAEVQGEYASAEEARATYRIIQKQGYGVKLAAFYVSLASFERKFSETRAEEILKRAISKGVQPAEELKRALSKSSPQTSLDVGKKTAATTRKERSSLKSPNRSLSNKATSRSRQPPSVIAIPPLSVPASRKRNSGSDEVSPKRQKMDQDTLPSVMDDSNMSDGTLDLSLDNMIVPKVNIREKGGQAEGLTNREKLESAEKGGGLKRQRKSKTETTKDSRGRPNVEEKEKSTGFDKPRFTKPLPRSDAKKTESRTRISLSSENDSKKKPSSARKRSSLLANAPRLKSTALLGGAKRLSPEENVMLDDSDDEEELEPVKPSKPVPEKPAPKVVKMNLSYMMNWDPSKRDNTQETAALVTKSRHASTGKVADTTDVGSKTGCSLVTSSTASTHTARSNHSNESTKQPDATGKQSQESTSDNREASSQEGSLLAKCNKDFLPLVNENNIIRVNEGPYVKLGVIGKGGSSKVYRALSKGCSVVAIKKVKLGNLDKKAIDGYANEIALLKKLRGSPAIIQMYDSEVDLSRKAIFLVMELGEVDLNCVLQQQALQSAEKHADGKGTLNMNFIRLTWQQMLAAVHSIHEERVIHGDLKPANFVFVRGALKLIDFGIAKAIQSDDTTNIYRDSQIGTLNYMSPEAILDTGTGMGGQRMKIGRASDIWSLGCILYQMVYGRTPFASLHLIQKLQAIVNPAHKIDYPGDTDDAAVDAIKQCLQRQAEDRPPIIGKNGLLNEHYFLNRRRLAKDS